MPVRSLETAHKIGEDELLPHLRNLSVGRGQMPYGYQTDNSLVIYFITGEEFEKGECATIIEGVAYKANNIASEKKPAMYIIMQDAHTEEVAPFTRFLEINIDDEALEDGDILWLTTGTPNYTVAMPVYEDGKIIQRIGFFLNNIIYPLINEPVIMNL